MVGIYRGLQNEASRNTLTVSQKPDAVSSFCARASAALDTAI
jgi:hypothetical protein